MKNDYIITNQELNEAGINLLDYAREPSCINAIIHKGLDIVISRCCYLNDDFKGEPSIEEILDKDTSKVGSFKKLQRTVIYNLLFTATDDPIDQYVDTIIVHELGWGKINGFQKGLWYKNY